VKDPFVELINREEGNLDYFARSHKSAAAKLLNAARAEGYFGEKKNICIYIYIYIYILHIYTYIYIYEDIYGSIKMFAKRNY